MLNMKEEKLEDMIRGCREGIDGFNKSKAHSYLDRIIEWAIINPRTGLRNKRIFQEEYERRSYSVAYSILFIDIDNFKEYNDTFGQVQGDCALDAVGCALSGNTRTEDGDVVAHYGGEEFVAILKKTNKDSAFKAAEKLRKIIEHAKIPYRDSFKDSGYERVTVSIGIASSDELRTKDFKTLLTEANKAKNLAKESGRNRVVVATKHV